MDIIINNLDKKYGNMYALKDLNLKIKENSTVGIIGHNGSGKTTLLEILSGLKKPTSGNVNFLNGKDFKEDLGVVLQENSFYEDVKVIELIKLFSTFYKSTMDVNEIISVTGIEGYINEYYKNLSGGMKQRVNIALAILNKPRLLLLDEPTTGLDPIAREDLWSIVRKQSNNTTILLSSHYMEEVEKYCSHILFLIKGNVHYFGEVKELINKEQKSLSDIYISWNHEGAKNQ
ncbi:ABC transporter ATP-binding protein [Bacillus sp. NPDC060175]|uniref:ABC transporter ATP-binding protein n=1 Tax=Bacillus sp. NPDC060175 TaxID=3347061 RepID=UPI0036558C46